MNPTHVPDLSTMNWGALFVVLRPYSLPLLIVGTVLLVYVALAGVESLRRRTYGPMGEVLLAIGAGCHLLLMAAWWLPAWLRT